MRLGIRLEEHVISLEPKDHLIFYTDGIVEAKNEEDEMFGFERLIEVVQASSSMPTELLLKEILDRVNEFVGPATQHDDMTVIVISVAK